MGLSSNDKRWARMAQGSFEEFLRDYDGPDDIDAVVMYNEYSKLDPDGNYKRRDDRKKGKAGSTAGDAPTTLGDWVQKGIGTQMKDNVGMAPHEFQDLNSVLSILLDNEGKIKNMGTIIKDMAKNIGEGIVLNFQQQKDYYKLKLY